MSSGAGGECAQKQEGTWRFVTWNLDWWQRRAASIDRSDVLRRLDADVIAVQEVRGSVATELRRRHHGPSVFSQELHPGATWRWMGCGLLLPPGGRLIEAGVVEALPKPQRSLWARVELPGFAIPHTVVSWHAPNAAGDGRETKMAAFEAMSRWLDAAPRPVVLGADLNTWADPVDLRQADADDPYFAEHAFVGVDPRHRLVDAYRRVLHEAGELDRLRRGRPEGPLAVSHVLSGGVEHRMDRILASPDLQSCNAGYDMDTAQAAGSDHALHWADFEAGAATTPDVP